MTELESLIRQRASIKTKVTIFNKFISNLESTFPDCNISDEHVVLELEQRLQRAQELINKFDDIQGQIDTLCDNIELQYAERESFETSFFAITTKAKYLLSKNALQPSSTQIPDKPEAYKHQNVKLPTIQLRKFNGNYDEWLEFRDTFDSLIHNNREVNNIQKFHYLRASLEGSALQIIQSLEFSSENYDVAWSLVCERYNNSRILVNNHVKALFNIEQIRIESPSSLRKMIDNLSKHLRALQTLNEPTQQWDTLLIYLVSTKLDPTTAREWEEAKSSLVKPTLHDLKQFLKNRSDLLESLEQSKQYKGTTKTSTRSFFMSKPYCLLCKKEHYIQFCQIFLKATPQERAEKLKKVKACINCLRTGHALNECRAGFCRQCNRQHNTLLHIDTRQTSQDATKSDSKPEEQPQTVLLSSQSVNDSQVILSTAQVQIRDKNNKFHKARVLLDAGSQSSFITDDLCKRLNLSTYDVNINVCGLNQACANVKHKTMVDVKSQINNFNVQLSCLIVPKITDKLPNVQIDPNTLNIPQHIKLADPNFGIPNKVDMLLGADCFWQLICIGQIKLRNGPILQKTRFGWIISGCIPYAHARTVECNFISEQQISNQLERFWTVEEISQKRALSQEEKNCESHFLETTKRNSDGRFKVTIPLKDSPTKLGDSYTSAKNRLLGLEKRFDKNPDFKQQYKKFISEYLSMGHMTKVTNDDSQISYYMPHHGVVKETSSTTKLRVVFDASALTTTGISFNSIQMVGPKIQQDLLSLLIRFRKYNFVIASDVEKMYRMVEVDPSQRSLQRILWRDDPLEPIQIFELNTVTYGTAAAAYLAIRCLYQIGVECAETSPRASNVIKHDFYVDDMLSGANTVDEAINLANDVARELQRGCFKLRKWVSNSLEILAGIQTRDTSDVVDFGINENTKTLGLMWNGQSDMLSYNINPEYNGHVSKRTILSETSQIFDPLGLLSPCTIIPKMILQNLWCEKLTWDESLPTYIHTKWVEFRKELIQLNAINIPRQITCKNAIQFDLHGFSDASQQAYGACVYLKCRNQNGASVNLVCAKSKVAPIKPLTIPRLELCAALLLVNLMEKVVSSLGVTINKVTYWTDSSVVLGWINTYPNQLQLFVSNRVATIQEKSKPDEWNHVSSKDNPADHLSRGVNPTLLPSLEIYWHGPSWLTKEEHTWPQTSYTKKHDLPEMKSTVYTHKISTDSPDLNFDNYSNLSKLERILAYCLRFKSNCLHPRIERQFGCLTSAEIQAASLCAVRISQRQCFPQEFEALSNGRSVERKSKLFKLNPFLEQDKIIRVGGRLANSNFEYNKKYPIVLSSKSNLTKLLFTREHRKMLHAGPQLLLSVIREKFWPIQGRNLARKTVNNCVICFKARPKSINPIMGNLPKSRLNPAPPFSTTGVDYAGPFLLKNKRGRGCKVSKCYIALFICFLTRAIHLELVSDLTKDAFIAALRRFVARRGKPFQMFSDNGTNFVGANADLNKLGQFLKVNAQNLTTSIENEGISWSFIPPYSPHFGGLWEAGVKSTKFHLLRVAGNASLTFEQLYTLLTQVESVLNSRPLTPLSCDPSDLTPLTPAHFLIGKSMATLPDQDLIQVQPNRLSHFQYVQQLQQHFWARWSKEYVSELQQRCKWQTNHGKLRKHDLVIIKEDHQPPLR